MSVSPETMRVLVALDELHEARTLTHPGRSGIRSHEVAAKLGLSGGGAVSNRLNVLARKGLAWHHPPTSAWGVTEAGWRLATAQKARPRPEGED